MVHLGFYKTCATEVFLVKLRCFYRVYKPDILVFSYPLLALKIRSSTRPIVRARMLPPKLYLVVFLSKFPKSKTEGILKFEQVILVRFTRLT